MRRWPVLLLLVAVPAWGARIVTSAARGNAADMGVCDASRENYRFTAYDESTKVDCDGTGGGSTKADCICRSNAWVPYKGEDIGTACASGKVMKSDGAGNLTCGTDLSGGGGGGSTTVEDVDSAPSYSPIDTLQVDQADGFVLTNPGGAGTARLDLSGIPNAALASSYSGVGACGANTFASTLNANAGPTCTQPSFANLSGTATDAQIPDTITIDLATAASDVTCTGCLGSTEIAGLDTADTTTGTFADARISSSSVTQHETALEGVLDLQDLQGAVTDAQVPNTITVDLATLATTATTANAGDSATAFFPSGTLEDARVDGSLEADEVNPTLGTQTQGNYVASVATTAPITGGAAGSEGAALTIALSQNAGTDVTADLEEETHASEHSLGGTDPITATNLASGCTNAQVLGGTVAGTGVECQADDDIPDAGDFGSATDLDSNGAVKADAVALGTDTTGNYAGSSSEGGAATTASAAAADGTDCSAGNYARGVDTAWNATNCTADDDTPDSDAEVPDDVTVASTHDIATSGKAQIGSLTAGSAACVAYDSTTDRLYHDSNCNGTQDTGESFIDGRTAEVSATFTAADNYKTVTVTGQTWVTANSTIACAPFGTTADGETIDEYGVGQFSAVASTVVAGTGFTVSAFSPNGVTGTYRFECFDTNGGGGSSAVLPYVHLSKSAAQTLTSNVETVITWDVEEEDVSNLHSGSGSTVTVALAGLYEVKCSLAWAGNVTSAREAKIYLNSTGIAQAAGQAINNVGLETVYPTSVTYRAAVGDTFSCKGYQLSGGNLAVNSNAQSAQTWMSVVYVGR